MTERGDPSGRRGETSFSCLCVAGGRVSEWCVAVSYCPFCTVSCEEGVGTFPLGKIGTTVRNDTNEPASERASKAIVCGRALPLSLFLGSLFVPLALLSPVCDSGDGYV